MAMEGRRRAVRVWVWVSFGVSGDVRGQRERAELHHRQSVSERRQPHCPQCHRTQISSRPHRGMTAPLYPPLHVFPLHTGAEIQMRISPLSYKPRGAFKNLSRRRDESAFSQRCTRVCFDKLIVSTAQVDGGFWRKSRDFLLHLTSPTQTPPFLSKQRCCFPSLSLPFFPEGIKVWDRKEHKRTNKQKAKRNYFCIETCRKRHTPFKWH